MCQCPLISRGDGVRPRFTRVHTAGTKIRGGPPFMLGLCAMRAREEKTVGGGEAGLQTVWIWRLVTGRLLVAGLLFGVSVLWTNGLAPGAQQAHRLGSALPFAFVVSGVAAVYALALRFTRLPLRVQAGAQFALDALLVTWLVWVTGNLYSPYTALYILIISAASIFLGARWALVTAVGCAACYTLTMLGLTTGWFGVGRPDLTAAAMAKA